MTCLKKKCIFALALLSMLGIYSSQTQAVTAQDIADAVIDELDAVSDYTATVDIDYNDVSLSDMTGGSLQWKRNSGSWKVKMVMGSPYSGNITTDGVGYNVTDVNDTLHWASLSNGKTFVRDNYGVDMFNMENILSDETWTRDANETVNSIECYKIYTTKSDSNYEVWVDIATMERIIRVEATDGNDNSQWQLDYSSYSLIENTAQLPATITTKYYGNGLISTHSLSSININENLSDSIFSIESP